MNEPSSPEPEPPNAEHSGSPDQVNPASENAASESASPENPDYAEPETRPVESVAETSPSKANGNDPLVSATRSIRPNGLAEGRKLAAAAARVALDNKGQDVMVLDVSAQSAEFDFFVLATGTSRRQLHAISEQIDDELEKVLGDHRMGIEGYEESRWIVLDYGNVVIHMFDDETREYYDLESLWADSTPVPLEELGLTSPDA